MLKLNLEQAKDCLIDCAKAQLMPFVKGSPGVGKSALVQEIAKEFNWELIDIRLAQCDPCDLN